MNAAVGKFDADSNDSNCSHHNQDGGCSCDFRVPLIEKVKTDFFVFSISSCLQCEQDQADQRSDSANCNHQKKELHFRKPLAVDLTVLGEIVACCQIRIQCNKDLLIIICNLIVQQIASRCFHGRAVFSCCIRTDFVGTAGPVNSKGERIGRFLRNGCCVTIFPGIHIRIDISFFILQTVPEIGIVRIDADAALLVFKSSNFFRDPGKCHIQIADGYLFQICRRVLIEVRSRFRFLRFQAHSLIV